MVFPGYLFDFINRKSLIVWMIEEKFCGASCSDGKKRRPVRILIKDFLSRTLYDSLRVGVVKNGEHRASYRHPHYRGWFATIKGSLTKFIKSFLADFGSARECLRPLIPCSSFHAMSQSTS